ncbi:MAG: hypothetical protein K6T34_06060 [Thermoflavifilum sp.]|nr:hypothetical protein [Thermoflavifilum sp.]
MKHNKRMAYLAAGVLLFILAFIGIRYWMLQHAESLIRKLVETQTNGQYDLQIHDMHIHNNLQVITLHQVKLKAFQENLKQPTFILDIPYLYIKIRHIPELIFNRALYMDSVICKSPALYINLNKNEAQISSMSLAEQMNRVYAQILQILNLLQIEHLNITQGKLIFSDSTTTPIAEKTIIQHIHLQIQHFKIDTATLQQQKKQKSLHNQVTFQLGPQTISLNHQQEKISFQNFYISTIDSSCRIHDLQFDAYNPNKLITSYNLHAKELYFKKNQFAQLYFNKTIQSDSLVVKQAYIDIHLSLQHLSTSILDTNQSIQHVLSRITDRAIIHQAIIQNASLQIHAGGTSTKYLLTGGNQQLALSHIIFDAKSKNPFSIQQATIDMHQYQFHSSDNSWDFSLRQLLLRQDTLTLIQPKLHHNNKKNNNQFYLNASSMILPRVNINMLISKRKLNPSSLILLSPNIFLVKHKSSSNNSINLIPTTYLTYFNKHNFPFLQNIQSLDIQNGRITLQEPNQKIDAKDVDASIHIQQFRNTYKPNLRHAKIGSIDFHMPSVAGYAEGLSIDDHHIEANLFHITHENGLDFSCSTCFVDSIGKAKNDSGKHIIQISQLGWQSAKINWQNSNMSLAERPKKANIFIQRLIAGETACTLSNDKQQQKINLHLIKANLDSLLVTPNKIRLQNFNIFGKDGQLFLNNRHIRFQQFQLHKHHESTVTQVSYTSSTSDSLQIYIPTLSWLTQNTNQHEIQTGLYHLKYIHIQAPHFQYMATTQFPHTSPTMKVIPIQADSLQITDAQIFIVNRDSTSISAHANALLYNFTLTENNNQVTTVAQHVQADISSLHIQQPQTNKYIHVQTLNVNGSQLSYTTAPTGNDVWHLSLDSLNLQKLNLQQEDWLVNGSGKFYNFQLTNTHSNFWQHIFSISPHARWQITTCTYQNPVWILHVWNNTYDAHQKILTCDSLQFYPALNLQQFEEQLSWQKDYIQFSSSKWQLYNFQPIRWWQDHLVKADSFRLYRPILKAYRDKRLPLNEAAIKPLPGGVAQLLPFRVDIHKWNIVEGYAAYTEVAPQTGKPVTVWFNDIDATISPFTSQPSQASYLQITAKGKLMDQPIIQLHYLEDIHSPLHLFTFQVQSSPFAFSLFNPMLESWFHAWVISGNIQHASMQARGNAYIITGNMNLYYDQLRISLNREKDSTGKKLYSGVENFLANLILRSKNFHRSGLVFYRRNPHLSFFNYWVKAVESGIGSSIMGRKWNRAYRHHYEKLIKAHPEYKQGL